MEISETIRDRMLASIDPKYDTSEGSFFRDIVSAVAIEFAEQQGVTEGIIDKGFVDTATGAELERRVAEQGLTRKVATYSSGQVKITGQAGATVAKGAKVSSDTVTYTVQEAAVVGTGNTAMVNVICDASGSIGNCAAGAIKYFPVTIAGLSAVANEAELSSGYDAETDDELRERYYEKVRTPPTSGNKYHYLAWAKEVTGVGDARVFPLWAGAGTVKVVIIDANKQGADTQLVTDTAAHIEDVRPVGATVTVVSAAEVAINVAAVLTLAAGYTLEQVQAAVESNISSHLQSTAFVDDYVSYAKIGNAILSTAGVLDYAGLTINSGTANIAIANTEVAVLGTVALS